MFSDARDLNTHIRMHVSHLFLFHSLIKVSIVRERWIRNNNENQRVSRVGSQCGIIMQGKTYDSYKLRAVRGMDQVSKIQE